MTLVSTTTGPRDTEAVHPLLSVRDLSITADTRTGLFPAVRDVSFELPASGSLALVGESGSGKSLTALAIAGLLAPQLRAAGSVAFFGQELVGLPWQKRRDLAGRHIGFVFQEPMSSLHPILTVGAQIDEALRAHYEFGKRERADRVRELLDLVGLSSQRDIASNRIGQLSGGMRQRVMIAMAISCEPELLIADEPTTALDVTLQKQIIDLLLSLRERMGLSLMLITHDLSVVAETCESAVVMYAGEVVERGRTGDILSSPRHSYTRALLEAIPVLGDTRKRLPTIAQNAPSLRDTRLLGEKERPMTRLVEHEGGRWVRTEEGSEI